MSLLISIETRNRTTSTQPIRTNNQTIQTQHNIPTPVTNWDDQTKHTQIVLKQSLPYNTTPRKLLPPCNEVFHSIYAFNYDHYHKPWNMLKIKVIASYQKQAREFQASAS